MVSWYHGITASLAAIEVTGLVFETEAPFTQLLALHFPLTAL